MYSHNNSTDNESKLHTMHAEHTHHYRLLFNKLARIPVMF